MVDDEAKQVETTRKVLPYEITIPGKLVVLRTAKEEDDVWMQKILSDRETMKHIAALDKDWTMEEIAQRRINHWKGQRELNNSMFLYMVVKDGDRDRTIGSSGFREIDVDASPSYGYWGIVIDKEYWGKGIGIEAMLLSLTYLFEVLECEKATSTTDLHNAKMRKFFEKGWTLDSIGEMDYYRNIWLPNSCNYSLKREDWPKYKTSLEQALQKYLAS
eukprot:TRINITY_DN13115_c0_g1_i1.p1 TRINITY_DN13115_c0_g1~~TRINITY_DN13115_c0_g1_i1.p1  ORF type:complete len:217 (-),score=54.97 TRINITY_DN13115_c0_g1_i1:7-657(-)